MTNELLALFEYYEKEKGIKRDTMIEALETALLSASRKSIGPAREMRIRIDPDKGDIRAYATLVVRDRVANPYEERVWVLLLQVLNQDDDRKVCLENIIAINPLNTDARRQLRQLVRREESQPQTLHPGWLHDSAPHTAAQPIGFLPLTPSSTTQADERGRFIRAILAGVGIGVLAVALGVGASILVYGGVLPSQMP